jgi:hypothetical protein
MIGTNLWVAVPKDMDPNIPQDSPDYELLMLYAQDHHCQTQFSGTSLPINSIVHCYRLDTKNIHQEDQ